MFYKIKDLLQGAINRLGVSDQARASLVVEVAQKVIIENFPNLKGKVKPRVFKDNTLYCEVTNPTLASQLNLEQQRIINQINRRLKGDFVKKVGFRIRGQS